MAITEQPPSEPESGVLAQSFASAGLVLALVLLAAGVASSGTLWLLVSLRT